MHRSASGQSSSYLQLRANKNLSIHTPGSTSSHHHHSNAHQSSSSSQQSSTYSSTRDPMAALSMIPTPSVSKNDSLRSSSTTFVRMPAQRSQYNIGSSTARPLSSLDQQQQQQQQQPQQPQQSLKYQQSHSQSYYDNKASELFQLLNRDMLQPNSISLMNHNNNDHNKENSLSHSNQISNNKSQYQQQLDQQMRSRYSTNAKSSYPNNPITTTSANIQTAHPKSPLALSNRSMTPVSPTPMGSSFSNSRLKQSQYQQSLSPNTSIHSTNSNHLKSTKSTISKKRDSSLYAAADSEQNTSINISHLLNLNTIFTNPSVYSSQQQQQQLPRPSYRASIEASASASSSSQTSNNNNNNNNNQAMMLENCVIIQKQNEIAGLRKDLRTAIAENSQIKNRLKVSEAECKTLRAQAETERRYRPLVDEYVGKIKGMQFLLAHEKRVSAKVIQETLLRNSNMTLILENLANIITIIQKKIDAMASPAEKILQSIRESLNPILMCLLPVIDDIHSHNQVIQGQISNNNQQNSPKSQSNINSQQQADVKNAKNAKRTTQQSKDTSTAHNTSQNSSINIQSRTKKQPQQYASSTNLKQNHLSQQQRLKQHSNSVRSSLQASNSSNQLLSRSVHATSVHEYTPNPADICRPRSVSQLPKNSNYSSQQQHGAPCGVTPPVSSNASAADILISDSFYQQCLTNNSLGVSESSYQASTMKFAHSHVATATASAAVPHTALNSMNPKTISSPTHRMSSHGLFEFSHSPESVSNHTNINNMNALGSFAKPLSSKQLRSATLLPGEDDFDNDNNDNENCIEHLLKGVADINAAEDFTNAKSSNSNNKANLNSSSSKFNESQKIFNNTLKGLSETLKNLREEDQFEPYQLSQRPSPVKPAVHAQHQEALEQQQQQQLQMPSITPSSTHKEIEELKNRILQRQSRRKLNGCGDNASNSASVSPCSRSSSSVFLQAPMHQLEYASNNFI